MWLETANERRFERPHRSRGGMDTDVARSGREGSKRDPGAAPECDGDNYSGGRPREASPFPRTGVAHPSPATVVQRRTRQAVTSPFTT